ncbi:T9SS type B sorting domain-containing protein, partial [Arthrospira platensis SPKY2]
MATGCASAVQSITIERSSPAVVTWTTSDPFAENQVVIVTAQGHGTYTYQLGNGPRQTVGTFSNLPFGPQTITVWDENGCTEVTITVEAINYPKFFTPNGDGFNDMWNVKGLQGTDAQVYIFDRYGKLLKQLSPSSEGWDGTFNGQLMPSSDYWFKILYTH